MFRFIVAITYAVLAMIFWMPRHWHLRSLARKNRKKSWEEAAVFVRGFFRRLLFICGTRIEVRGEENIPDGAVLFVGNHRSYFDIIILQKVLDRPIGFVAKQEFKKIPLFHHYMDDIGCLYLDRDNVRQGMRTINTGIEYMQDGLSMGLYPEGTRNHDDTLMEFKTGGYRMAEKSGAPIVLTAATGFDDIFENNHPGAIKKKHVVIEFDKPVYVSEMSNSERKQFYHRIPDRIQEMIDGHKE